MKTAYNTLLAAFLLLSCGCASLQPDGPYKGDKVLYNADVAITTAYDVLHRFVTWEYENRAALAPWPEIKRAADQVRLNSPGLINSAITLRETYAATKTSAARDSLSTVIALLRASMLEAVKYITEHPTP
jgi:hypothetical protein